MFQQPTMRITRALLIMPLLLAALLFATQQTAQAQAGIIVTTNADSGAGSLRQAVIDANDTPAADTITFDPTVITITLSSQIVINSDLTIDGGGTVIVDGNNATRLFRVQSGTVTIDNITLQNGAGSADCGGFSCGGAIKVESGAAITVSNSTLSGNEARSGGGIYNDDGTATVSNSTLSDNEAAFRGGGIINYGTTTVSNSTLSGNKAPDGGGILNWGTVTVSNSTLSGNEAPASGGGIHNIGTATVSNSTLSGNKTTNRGGGIYNTNVGTATVNNSTLSGNEATGQSGSGGGIFNDGTATVSNSIIANSTTGGNCVSVSLTASNISDDGSCGIAATLANSIIVATLADNGCVTPHATTSPTVLGCVQTHALLPGSAAIDNPNSDTTTATSADQRGIPTTGTSRDIGAYEVYECSQNPWPVNNTFALNEAIQCYNTSLSGSYVISVTQNFTLTSPTIPITNTTGAELLIAGDGNTLDGANSHRLFTVQSSDVTIDEITLQNGAGSADCFSSSASCGGAIKVESGAAMTMTKSTVISSTAQYGGGIINFGTATVSNSTLSGNSATRDGGGIYNRGTATVSNSTLSGNEATRQGGGIYNNGNGTATVSNSTLSGNEADIGGGIFNGGTARVSNSTLSGNEANTAGGIYNNGNGTATVSNSTLSGNSTGGIVNWGGGTATVSNSIIANSTSGGNCQNVSLTTSNISDDGSCVVPATPVNSIIVATLADNGCVIPHATTSPTVLGCVQTHALLPGSAAIDNTNVITLGTFVDMADQREVATFGARRDTGAFEATDAEVGIVKTVSPTSASYGETVTYTIAFSNTGALASSTAITDLLPSELTNTTVISSVISSGVAITQTGSTFAIGDLPAGASRIITITGEIAPTATTFTNTATITATNDVATTNNSAAAVVTVQCLPFPRGVNDTDELNNAIFCYNQSPAGSYVISVTQNFTLTSPTIPITNTTGADLLIAGDGNTLDGANSHRHFTVQSSDVNIDNITLQNGTGIADCGSSASCGGAIKVESGAAITVTNSTLSGNVARSGGGIYNDYGTATVSNSTLSDNEAAFRGGGIINYGTTTVSNSTLSGNVAANGGGIINYGTATVSNSTLSGNSAAYGGGISNRGTATVSNSTLSGNSATRDGGGIYNDEYGTATVSNSTLSGNSATRDGGGIFNEHDGTATVSNSTLSGNSATRDGGGIHNENGGGRFNPGDATVSNSTLSGNSADNGGGIFNRGTATVSNSIIANSATGGNCSGRLSLTASSISDDGSCNIAATPANSIIVATLADNGCVTPHATTSPTVQGCVQTHALLPGSAAIDMGDPGICATNQTTTAPFTIINNLDQRGVTRLAPNAQCDIGAYEAVAGSIILEKITIPANVAGQFNFTGSISSTLSHGLTSTHIVVPNVYTVTEPTQPGWDLSAISCDSGQNGSRINLNAATALITVTTGIGTAPSAPVTCTFTNTQRGTITIIKDTVPNDGQDFAFSTTGGLTPATFNLDDDADATLTNTQTFTNVLPGPYTVSETAFAGYATSVTCIDTDNGTNVTNGTGATATIDLDPGENIICTFTNAAIDPILTLRKVVSNTNGGSLSATAFTLNALDVDGNGIAGAGTLVNASDPTVAFITGTLSAGKIYTLTESTVAGYSASAWGCDGGTQQGNTIRLALDTAVTCTITNSDQAATLTVTKVVSNSSGGTAACDNFAFTVGGTSYPFEADCSNEIMLPAGTYTVTEDATPIAGYATSYANCSNVALTNGGAETCTITNSDQAATLTVTKVVDNSSGTAACDNFAFTVGGTSYPFEADCSNEIMLPAGTYTVTEDATPIAGYATSYANCSNVALTNGGVATCTITNSDQAATLTVTKVVDNSDGGTATCDNFAFTVGGISHPFEADCSNEIMLPAGTYTVTEDATPIAGYATSYANCSNVVLTNGDAESCTITNSDQAATLTVTKVVDNTDGGTATCDNFAFTVGGTSYPFEADCSNEIMLPAGTYTVTEDATPIVGYATSYANCSNVALTNGGAESCTITNSDQAATLTVTKVVSNSSGGTATCDNFAFTVGGTSYPFEADCSNEIMLPAGTYTVTEDATPIAGYTTSYANCSNVALTNGDAESCTITNSDQAATLTVTKVISNTNGGTAACDNFAFTVGGTSYPFEADCSNEIMLPAGTYTVTEDATPVAGYATSYANCSNVALINGGAETCTITNSDQAATLTVTKVVDNTDGGTATCGDFSFTVGGISHPFEADCSNEIMLPAGTYTVTEDATPVAGYATSYANCSNVALINGGAESCTITNSDQAATLTVTKIVDNSDGGTATCDNFSFTVGGISHPFEADCSNEIMLPAGTYTVTEDATPIVGYATSYANCSNVALTNGGAESCTITNDDVAPAALAISIVDPYSCGGNIYGSVAGGMPGYSVTIGLTAAGSSTPAYSFSPTVNADGSFEQAINYSDPADPNYVAVGPYTNDYAVADSVNQTASGSYELTVAHCIYTGVTWMDVDEDGVRDPSEAGVGEVTITLYDAAGNQVAVATSDADGTYSFSAPEGEYNIEFTPIAGVTLRTGQLSVTLPAGGGPAVGLNGAIIATPTNLNTGKEPTTGTGQLYLPLVVE